MPMRASERGRTVVTAAPAVAVVVAGISACGGGNRAGEVASTSRATTTAEPTTTSTALDETTQAIYAKAAYLPDRWAAEIDAQICCRDSECD
jgi:hypothetical protein